MKNPKLTALVCVALLLGLTNYTVSAQWTDAGSYLHATNNESAIRLGEIGLADGAIILGTRPGKGLRILGNSNVGGSGSILLDLENDGDLFVSQLNLDNPGSTDQMRVRGIEAVGNVVSTDHLIWGAGATYNSFPNAIVVGTQAPKAAEAFITTAGKEMAMYGDNSYVNFYPSSIGSTTRSGFLGCNQFGGMFFESNVDKVVLDGETGINFLISDQNKMVIDANGNVGIGTTSPAYKLQVVGNADITGELTAASDLRLKKDIQPIKNALASIKRLNPVAYNFRTEEFVEMNLSHRRKLD